MCVFIQQVLQIHENLVSQNTVCPKHKTKLKRFRSLCHVLEPSHQAIEIRLLEDCLVLENVGKFG